ncbi:MAG: thioredoxin [Candidatus Hatepunaea meridiana]|nr:thioredoxin [Candidatus Hatepunaea meridiana]
MADYVTLTDAEFEAEVIKSNIPVLVDIWAPWCQPCLMVAPFLVQIAAEYKGKLKVCKLNVDDNKEYAMKYGISSIPTMLIFKNGQMVKQVIGAMPKAEIENLFKPFI